MHGFGGVLVSHVFLKLLLVVVLKFFFFLLLLFACFIHTYQLMNY